MNVSQTLLGRTSRAFVEAAGRLVMAFSPATWTPTVRHAAAQRLWQDALQTVPRFVLLGGLLSLAIVHIVVITTQNYGLSQFALSTVIRLLVVELLPLLAAINITLTPVPPAQTPYASGVETIGESAVATLSIAHVVSRGILVIMLTTVGGAIALGIAYLGVYGVTPWGLTAYTHTIGQVFNPIVLLALALKTLLFSLAVATLDGTALIFGVLIALETLLLLVEFL